jgi:hypothetical protein
MQMARSQRDTPLVFKSLAITVAIALDPLNKSVMREIHPTLVTSVCTKYTHTHTHNFSDMSLLIH